ncbi:UV DNA damage repair endonuclease UvsE [Alkalibaculum sp. M08DMB]|uniref:UV DNA damage repair endonuclease UvsE n=1 Tax=Alkalibaculum sporogenes TaxID=2655001 RepID=A0A6A7K8H4_9FIRM|nr:UV DNA damage repair endonuclease UvsE [Alkalibaculum sporogenes]MPW25724.1 UV DNA damage repair endonuclease UvsE [Alkalibaculum sporogenes]
MSIGYACLTVGVPNTNFKSCIMKNFSESKLLELISHNLNSLENIIDYNIKNNIKLFRLSSDVIPFGSSPINTLPWWDLFSNRFSAMGNKVNSNGIRISMHPGQYTVLNSPNEDVVYRAIEDLKYHNRFLDSFDVGTQHKIVLHIGGIYNNKEEAITRFITNYYKLDESVKSRIVIENDDKLYNIGDVLDISKTIKVPVIYDNLHSQINPFDKEKKDFHWIELCRETWKEKDGFQKVHYSQQDVLKRIGSHSTTINVNGFLDYYETLEGRQDLDIMLEVKDKNLSAIKCINCTTNNRKISALELEWTRYKYLVLEKAPTNYLQIRKLLNDKDSYPVISFYNLIENALQKEININHSINAAQHIWGYFKDIALEKERSSFFKSLENYEKGKVTLKTIKNLLWKLTQKYNQTYLMDSYYFIV